MLRSVACLLCAAAPIFSQSPAPRFEVASIKPTPLDQYNGSSGIASGHGRINGERVTLKRCILGAYAVGPNQVIGGPPWMDTDRFEIAARAEGPAGDTELMVMLRTLLAERFQLTFHHETRTLEALALEVLKTGAKMEKAPDCESNTSSHRGLIEAKCTGMDRFVQVLARDLNVPVVNQTGLEGAFNFKLEWSPDADRPIRPGETPADTGPSIYTAIQQLGLRLQGHKTPIEVMVIDRAEKPTEN